MKKKILPLILVAVVLLFSACGTTSSGNPSNSLENSVFPSENAEKDDKAVGFSGTISGDCFDISIVNAIWTDTLETSLGAVAPKNKGSKLLCLIFSAKNTADDTKNLGSFNAYINNQATLPTVVAGGIDDAMIFVGAVASGMEMKAYMVWELPENWEEFQLYYFEATGPECPQHFVIYPSDISAN